MQALRSSDLVAHIYIHTHHIAQKISVNMRGMSSFGMSKLLCAYCEVKYITTKWGLNSSTAEHFIQLNVAFE